MTAKKNVLNLISIYGQVLQNDKNDQQQNKKDCDVFLFCTVCKRLFQKQTCSQKKKSGYRKK